MRASSQVLSLLALSAMTICQVNDLAWSETSRSWSMSSIIEEPSSACSLKTGMTKSQSTSRGSPQVRMDEGEGSPWIACAVAGGVCSRAALDAGRSCVAAGAVRAPRSMMSGLVMIVPFYVNG